eukprot:3079069-Prymnesium_polylepis.1
MRGIPMQSGVKRGPTALDRWLVKQPRLAEAVEGVRVESGPSTTATTTIAAAIVSSASASVVEGGGTLVIEAAGVRAELRPPPSVHTK